MAATGLIRPPRPGHEKLGAKPLTATGVLANPVYFSASILIVNIKIGDIMEKTVPLRQLKVGARALIDRILAEGELGRRIRDMGLVPGADLEIIGRAPLKDPVALRLKGFTLTLRSNEADFIMVSTPEDRP
jgi:ferrous iron transport protein A